ncbi:MULTISPECIES: EAL and HDOD domain-containing protein [Bacillaceae]|uniref:EAL and HDOD domain-containing protein n=1 Tax=Bacillaceae TaxID=186817 RepID=UPI0029649E1D|nr:HDOD domain-containing protein [Bacillus infantis]MDW2878606.1 HDOD domain-containing protein [Bacillus infantis]
MEVFVGRQPIFDIHQELFGYELLNRTGKENVYLQTDGDMATLEVLKNSFLSIGMDKLADGKKCFINFTEKLILNDIPTYFDKEAIAIEILEDIIPSSEILQACAKLKQLGYTIVLDDFVLKDENRAFLEYANIIKVDIIKTNIQGIGKILRELPNKDVKLLAEKVETREDFTIAKSLGFTLFQGYFFSKPVVINAKDVSSTLINQQHLYLLNKIDDPEPDIDEIAELVENDFSLTYKILRIVNSAAYHMRNKINSIKQAIMVLGLYELRKWVLLMAISDYKSAKDNETIKLSMCRAKFAESIGKLKQRNISEYFLLGLFSLIDTILERPMEEILVELPLTPEMQEALLGHKNEFALILDLLSSLERGISINELSSFLNIPEDEIYRQYVEAIGWADSLNRSINA